MASRRRKRRGAADAHLSQGLAAAERSALRMKDRALAGALSLAALLLYGLTAAPSVATVFDDSLEFQVVLPTLGLAHPTGYPLYTLLGWLFTRLLPLGDAAWRANIFSAVAAALTVGLLYRLLLRISGARWAALAVASAFAVSPLWWSQATLAEVYALHGLFVVILWLAVCDAGSAPNTPALPRRLLLLSGLALTHHRMALLLAPGLALLAGLRWWGAQRPAQRSASAWAAVVMRDAASAAVYLLAPLSLYAYLWLRGRAIPTTAGVWLDSWPALWEHVTASAYGVFFAAQPVTARIVTPLQLGPIVALAGLWGLWPWPSQGRRWLALTLTLLVQGVFALGYRTADADVFFLPLIVLFTPFAAVGATRLCDAILLWLAQQRRAGLHLPGQAASDRIVTPIILTLLLAAMPLQQAWAVLNAAPPAPQTCEEVLAVGLPPSLTPNRRGDWRVYDCAQDILSQPLEPGAAVIGLLGEMTLLRFFQQTAAQRTDLRTIVADEEGARRQAVMAELAAGRPVYLLRPLPGLLDAAGTAAGLTLDAVGPLLRVRSAAMPPAPEPAALPQPLSLTPALTVVAATSWPVATHQGRVQRIGLVWQVGAALGEEWHISARLLDASGRIVAQRDAVPVLRAHPTSAWRPNDRIVDVYDLTLAGPAAQAAFTPLLILYRAADGQELGRITLPPFIH